VSERQDFIPDSGDSVDTPAAIEEKVLRALAASADPDAREIGRLMAGHER
jgi:hypothetical protein